MTQPLAAIDCGTNSIRLLIKNGDERVVERAIVTRLGLNVHAEGRLDQTSIAKTLEVLTDYRNELDNHDAELVRVVATSAVRDAADGAQFLDMASDILEVRVESITGNVEAALTFAGAMSASAMSGEWTVVDIGGGSTELATGTSGGLDAARSFQVGSVRLTEMFLHGDPPARSQFDELVAYATRVLSAYEKPAGLAGGQTRLAAVGGTATSLCAIDQGLQKFEFDRVHGRELQRDAIGSMVEEFLAVDAATRAHQTGLDPGRADVIVAGAGILLATMTALEVKNCRISAMDILDALVAT